ncbi:uncharacterized protein LOC100842353 [Brachypodium distachyon]|uniref:Uncharacterized protein n=1 Tax=Brachypodium distachyon TaxID=15368 RepID=A0A0Q3FNE2_BRADI|nr:uncharacterized protein LOC100842353 [Brachypodium distachyon]KQK01000.1 hypothetical protein BRADI_3g53190v3 [Brachypodium distachyon]|eukprot:XP_003572871.1 uncharacterized protein LOC100842353 [Brachypodium distachyon]
MSSPAESYERLGRAMRWRRRARGFRLCAGRSNRFSVRRLRAKLVAFLGLVGRSARLLATRLGRRCARTGSSSTRELVATAPTPAANSSKGAPRRAAASFMRTNSFYAQAIADCLEFIKRNSVPVEDYSTAAAAAAGSIGAAGKRTLAG